MFNKKAVSPLVATILLVAFSVGLGALVMSWGEDYIEEQASFVQGGSEVKTGCDAVDLGLIKIGGVPQVCKTSNTIELWLDNGPNIDLSDLHVRIAGFNDIDVYDSTLTEPLLKENSEKVTVSYNPDIGRILQVKLTPKIFEAGQLVSCTQKAITIEQLPLC
jgi:flagellin-like protein